MARRLRGLGHDDMDDKPVPTLVAPDRLLGARIGRGLPLEPIWNMRLVRTT